MTTLPRLSHTDEFGSKRILVTGGTKGAGKAIANRFLQGGGTVIIEARSAPKENTGGLFIQADVSTPGGVSKVVATFSNDSRESTSLFIMSVDHRLQAAASLP